MTIRYLQRRLFRSPQYAEEFIKFFQFSLMTTLSRFWVPRGKECLFAKLKSSRIRLMNSSWPELWKINTSLPSEFIFHNSGHSKFIYHKTCPTSSLSWKKVKLVFVWEYTRTSKSILRPAFDQSKLQGSRSGPHTNQTRYNKVNYHPLVCFRSFWSQCLIRSQSNLSSEVD